MQKKALCGIYLSLALVTVATIATVVIVTDAVCWYHGFYQLPKVYSWNSWAALMWWYMFLQRYLYVCVRWMVTVVTW